MMGRVREVWIYAPSGDLRDCMGLCLVKEEGLSIDMG